MQSRTQSPAARLGSEEPASIQQQGPIRYAKPSEWAGHKELIRKLYLDENKTLDEVMQIMESEHHFRATPTMFKKRIRSWHFLKKLGEEDVLKVLQQKLEREAAGEYAPAPVIRGRVVRSQRLKRFLERRPETLARLQASAYGVVGAPPMSSRWASPDEPVSTPLPKVLPLSHEFRDMEKTLSAVRDYVRVCALGPDAWWKRTYEHDGFRKCSTMDLRTARMEMTRAVDDFYLMQASVDNNRPVEEIFTLLNSTLNRLNHLIKTELPDMFFQMVELLQHRWSNYTQLSRIFRRHVAELAMVQLGRNHPLTVLWMYMLREHEGEPYRVPLSVLHMLLQEFALALGSSDQLTSMSLQYLLRFLLQNRGPTYATRQFKDWLCSHPGWDGSETLVAVSPRLAALREGASDDDTGDTFNATTSAGAIHYLSPNISQSDLLEVQFCKSYISGRIAFMSDEADRVESWFLKAKAAALQHEGRKRMDLYFKATINLYHLYSATAHQEKLDALLEELTVLKAELAPDAPLLSGKWDV